MRKNELGYRTRVVEVLEHMGAHYQVHEDKLQRDIPDLSYALKGKDTWLELKWKSKFPFPTTRETVGVTNGQVDWLRRRGRSGCGSCWLLVGTDKGHYLCHWTELSRLGESTAWLYNVDIAHALWAIGQR